MTAGKEKVCSGIVWSRAYCVCAADSEVCYKEQSNSAPEGKLYISLPALNSNISLLKYVNTLHTTANSIQTVHILRPV